MDNAAHIGPDVHKGAILSHYRHHTGRERAIVECCGCPSRGGVLLGSFVAPFL